VNADEAASAGSAGPIDESWQKAPVQNQALKKTGNRNLRILLKQSSKMGSLATNTDGRRLDANRPKWLT
jgi:hypothetical protein